MLVGKVELTVDYIGPHKRIPHAGLFFIFPKFLAYFDDFLKKKQMTHFQVELTTVKILHLFIRFCN